MALGRPRREQKDSSWVATDQLGSGPRNAFYDRLNPLLAEIEFDRKLEEAAEPYYEKTGRRKPATGRLLPNDFHRLFREYRQPTWDCLAV